MQSLSGAQQTIARLMQDNDRLQSENNRLRICPTFGILTRSALDITWESLDHTELACIYLDIDDMKGLNRALGHAQVDEMIRLALLSIRGDDYAAIGRCYSGDEIVALVRTEALSFALERIPAAFAAQGIGVTIGWASCDSLALADNILKAQQQVEQRKRDKSK